MIASLYLLHREQHTGRYSERTEAVTLFLAVLAKCLLNGYDYITTTFLMMWVPYAYYGLRDRWPRPRTPRRVVVVGLAAGVAVLASVIILNFQVAAATGDLLGEFKQVVFALGKRSYGDPSAYGPEFAAGLTASPLWVVEQYLAATAIDMRAPIRIGIPWVRRLLRVSYWELIVWFALASAALYILQQRSPSSPEWNRRAMALVGATWFSLLAPLSWFVLFKAHSYVHRNMNEVAWHMPFVLLGFALCGLALQGVFTGLVRKHPGAKTADGGHGASMAGTVPSASQ